MRTWPRRIRLENGLSGSTEYQRRADIMMNRRGGPYWRIRDLDGDGWHWQPTTATGPNAF